MPAIRERMVASLVNMSADLAADGAHGASVMSMVSALAEAGAAPIVIAPTLGKVKTSDRTPMEALATLENSPPVLFDAEDAADAFIAAVAKHRHPEREAALRQA